MKCLKIYAFTPLLVFTSVHTFVYGRSNIVFLFTAPEMLRGDSYGISVDWWCLGVMAYAMLCGRYPFNSGFGKLHLDHSLNDRQIMLKRIELGELPFPSFIPFAAEVVVRKVCMVSKSKKLYFCSFVLFELLSCCVLTIIAYFQLSRETLSFNWQYPVSLPSLIHSAFVSFLI